MPTCPSRSRCTVLAVRTNKSHAVYYELALSPSDDNFMVAYTSPKTIGMRRFDSCAGEKHVRHSVQSRGRVFVSLCSCRGRLLSVQRLGRRWSSSLDTAESTTGSSKYSASTSAFGGVRYVMPGSANIS